MNMQVNELHAFLQSGSPVTLIDVRTPVEYEEMRIPGSTLMPLDGLRPEWVKAAAAGKPCILICRGGKRAETARHRLHDAGCESLMVLEGGVLAWESAGFPLERSTRKTLPLMRQVQLVIGLLALTGSLLALTCHQNFAFLPAFLGAGLTMAGATGWCGLAILLSKMPWNRVAGTGESLSCSR
jgi:rhodanese-related sulfurtransferase